MGHGVFIHRSGSRSTKTALAEHYQFPHQYLGRVRSCVGDWIIYYEPCKVADTRGYFAVAKVERVISRSYRAWKVAYLAMIEPGSYRISRPPSPFSGALCGC